MIFERHQQALVRYCQSIVGNAHDAADALQNTMVRALSALPGETRAIALRPWLYRIAHNESISLIRARRSDGELYEAAGVGDTRLDAITESRDRLRQLGSDLRELTDQQRCALVMHELGGLEFAELGAVLGISDAAAKQSVYEGRRALQSLQEGRQMDCGAVRRTLSGGDGRSLRAKKIRGHLRDCSVCQTFDAGLRGQPEPLAALLGGALAPRAKSALLRA